jgi:hypothetical protein
MAKQHQLTELVWAEKDGHQRRQFTRQQLNAMGTDPSGNTYDGWKITQAAKEPKEVTAAKAKTKASTADQSKGHDDPGPKGELGPTGIAGEQATKNDTDNGTQTVATEGGNADSSKDSGQ